MVSRPAANDASVIDNACGVFGEDALPGRIDAAPKESPMPTVCVTANGKLNARLFDVRLVVFGMVAKQNTALFCIGKLRNSRLIGAVFLFGKPRRQTANANAVPKCTFIVQKRNARSGDLFANFGGNLKRLLRAAQARTDRFVIAE